MLVNNIEKAMLVDAFRFLDKKQNVVEDAHGNISCRVDGGFLIKPSGMSYDEIQVDDIVSVACSNAGFSCVGSRKASVDTEHHYEIYVRNPSVKSICHTHSPYATAFAIACETMPVCCTEHADYFGHDIRCLPYADLHDWGKTIKLDNKEYAVLLENHGVLICSHDENPLSAVKLAVALESIAKKYILSKSLSGLKKMNKHEISKWFVRYNNHYGQ